jgi:hypothetical protein
MRKGKYGKSCPSCGVRAEYRARRCRACKDAAWLSHDPNEFIELWLAGTPRAAMSRRFGLSRARVYQLGRKYRLEFMLGVDVR